MIESYDIVDTDIPHAEQTETVQTLHFPWDDFRIGRTRVICKPTLYHFNVTKVPTNEDRLASNEMRTTDLQSDPFMVAFTTRSSVRGMTCILRLGLAAYSVVSVCSNVSLVIT